MKTLILLIVTVSSMLTLSACHVSTGGSPLDDRDKLSVTDMQHILHRGFDIPFSSENTKIVHRDGLDGSSIDIDRVLVSKANNSATGDLLAVGFDGVMDEALPEGTVATLYLDMDDGISGYEIGDIKANYLLLNGNKSDATVPDYSLYAYDGNNWLPYILYQHYALFEDVEQGFKAVVLPDTAGVDEILEQSDVRAILLLRAFENRDPNAVKSTSAATDSFRLDTP